MLWALKQMLRKDRRGSFLMAHSFSSPVARSVPFAAMNRTANRRRGVRPPPPSAGESGGRMSAAPRVRALPAPPGRRARPQRGRRYEFGMKVLDFLLDGRMQV